jgi:hypothetical protein
MADVAADRKGHDWQHCVLVTMVMRGVEFNKIYGMRAPVAGSVMDEFLVT